MTPECTFALCQLDALKEQHHFHYHRIEEHIASFAMARLKAFPFNTMDRVLNICVTSFQPIAKVNVHNVTSVPNMPTMQQNIIYWAHCIGYELLCELLISLIREVRSLSQHCISFAKQRTMPNTKATSHSASSPSTKTTSIHSNQSSIITDYKEECGNYTQCDANGQATSNPAKNTGGMRSYKRKKIAEQQACNIGSKVKSSSCDISNIDSDKCKYGNHEYNSAPEQNPEQPARGRSALPAAARALLDRWLCSHWHDPYPTLVEKQEVCLFCHHTIIQPKRADIYLSDSM